MTWTTRLCGCLMLAVGAGVGTANAQMSAREIVDKVDRILRGQSSHGVATMEVVTEHWQRSLTLEVWSLRTDYALVRILNPRREAGTATLKAGNDIWNYLPRVDRTIKIPTSLMMGSWMGSHFTHDDIVKESRLIEDYDIVIAYQGPREGVEVWELRLTPKPEAPVIWGRIEYQVRRSDEMPIWARYFDEDGELARTLIFDDFRVMGGRLIPTTMEMFPEDKPNERTTVRYSELQFDIGLSEGFFSLRALRAGGG